MDVVIVGYGPVGALAALLLGRRGVDVIVLERRNGIHPLPRAVAADDEVQHILIDAGLADAVRAMLPARGARFVGSGGRTLLDVDLGPGAGGLPGVALYRQPELERSLRQAVSALPNVRVRQAAVVDVAQDAAEISVRLDDGSAVRAAWLLGCDGAGSMVRRVSGIAFVGPADDRRWLVADLRGTPPRGLVAADRVTYRGDPARPAVTMPTPGGWRLEVPLPGRCAEPDGPVEASRARRLAAGYLPDDDAAVERTSVYTFRTRVAAQWRQGRVLLAGDAAHTMPPFAGQGLGAGIRDVHNLAWKLAAVVLGEADPALLDTYEVERRAQLREVLGLTRFIGALVSAPPRSAAARDRLLRAARSTPRLGPWLEQGGLRRPSRLPRSAWPALLPGTGRGGGLLPSAPGFGAADQELTGGWRIVGMSGRSGQVAVVRPDGVVAGFVAEASVPAALRVVADRLHLAAPPAVLPRHTSQPQSAGRRS